MQKCKRLSAKRHSLPVTKTHRAASTVERRSLYRREKRDRVLLSLNQELNGTVLESHRCPVT